MKLECKNITFGYSKDNILLKNVSLSLDSSERLGIVAKSGFGKSTLAKIISGYEKPFSGEIFIDGKPINEKGYNPVQLIYQHPEKAINPRLKMDKVLLEGNVLNDHIMKGLGIKEEWLKRYPSELSGGELQRFSVARALNNKTKFIVADEITTMLDAVTQAEIWGFLIDECKSRNIGMIIVTHN
ncbi:MAG: ATP-binding cassette domain-containing protein, partial [Tyzzerella sp.]|nr:ATP-binding cassette domain-containing protein [Candidatus Fimicola merdigallinarum]